MDKETHEKQVQPGEPATATRDDGNSQPDVTKRKLLKGAVTTAPVVMAVSSKPALAGFCTVSGFLSGNLSNPHSQEYCGGRSPGYWINHVTEDMKHTKFTEVFGKVWRGKYGDWSHDPMLKEVLHMDGNDDLYQFGAHAVAAYQNALVYAGTYPMSIYDVGNIVGDVLLHGSYTDETTGRVLDAQEVVAFFSQTFDAD
jgi:hypothetical protein